jgi:hypothetical protein
MYSERDLLQGQARDQVTANPRARYSVSSDENDGEREGLQTPSFSYRGQNSAHSSASDRPISAITLSYVSPAASPATQFANGPTNNALRDFRAEHATKRSRQRLYARWRDAGVTQVADSGALLRMCR